jgi:hypothetical protein
MVKKNLTIKIPKPEIKKIIVKPLKPTKSPNINISNINI